MCFPRIPGVSCSGRGDRRPVLNVALGSSADSAVTQDAKMGSSHADLDKVRMIVHPAAFLSQKAYQIDLSP